jgi:hypothetical protein
MFAALFAELGKVHLIRNINFVFFGDVVLGFANRTDQS